MTPIPPACAMAIASAPSVTVSIAAETSGMPSSISRVSLVRVSVSPGRIPEAAGTSITSSKVSACRISIGASYPMATHYKARTPRTTDMGAAQRLCAPAEPFRDNIGLRRFGAARRRLGVTDFDKGPLQLSQQPALGAALKHFGEKGAAGFE